MPKFFSQTTAGFYAEEIHGARTIEGVLNPGCKIPADAVEITDERHAELLAEQSGGKVIIHDAAGLPFAVDPPPPTKEQRKAGIQRQLEADLASGVVHGGKKYHTDDRFVTELLGLIMSHQLGLATGKESIRTMDNEIVQLDVNELIALGSAVGARRKALYQSSWSAKDAL